MDKPFAKLGWLTIPATVLLGDFVFRWGGRLPANLSESPSNLLASIGLSALVWWAASRLIGSSSRRWLWAAAVALPAAFLTAVCWRFAASTGHDPGATAMVYLWQEPASSLRMMRSRISFGFGAGFVGLAGLWMLALGAYRAETSALLRRCSMAAPLIWIFAAAMWPAGMAIGHTPYTADFHTTHSLVRGAIQIASGRAESTLGVANRTALEDIPDRPQGPNVIIFIAESLRRDRMQLYGHQRPTTPRISAFFADHAGQAHRFERATSTSAMTNLSVPSILSGLYMAHPRPTMHRAPVVWHYGRAVGARSFLVTAQDWGWQNMDDFLLLDQPPDHVHTARSIGTPIVNDVGIHDDRATEVLAELVREDLDTERPFVGVVQANATHFPFLAEDDVPWEVDTVRDVYDAAISVTDRMFGELVDALADTDRLEDTVIIFVSDHGEFFYDVDSTDRESINRAWHDGLRVRSCHPAITAIPMFIYVPEKWAERLAIDREVLDANRHRLVSTTDVVATVLDLWDAQNLPAAAGLRQLDGHSLLEPIDPQRTAFCFNSARWQLQRGSGFSAMGGERAIYGRNDLDRLHVYDLNEPRNWSERGPGEAPDDDDRAWLDELGERVEFLGPYLQHIAAPADQ